MESKKKMWLPLVLFVATVVHLCQCGEYFRSMRGLAALLPTEKALIEALQRHIEHCENTWRRATLVSPPQHLELLDELPSPSRIRRREPVLLRYLRLSVLPLRS
ncbi:hypothetical protein MTO96_020128 [Rhipicephalus appendiculatus]